MAKSKQTPVATAAATLVQTTAPSGATITSAAPSDASRATSATIATAALVHHISATDTAALAQYGQAFAASFTAVDLNTAKITGDASALALILNRCGAGTVYQTYTEARAAFIAGMVDRSAEAAERFWQRAYAAARDTKEGSTLPKGGPASTDPNAVKSAKQRAGKAAAVADARTPAELLAAAAAASKAGDYIGAGKLAKLAAEKTTAADRAAKEKARDATKAQRDAIHAAVKRLCDAGNTAALAAVLKLCLKHSPEPAAVVK